MIVEVHSYHNRHTKVDQRYFAYYAAQKISCYYGKNTILLWNYQRLLKRGAILNVWWTYQD